MSNYFCQWPELEFVRKDGSKVLARDALRDVGYVLLYFSAGWHSGCRSFSPILANFYDTYAKEKDFEVVYLPRDESEAEMMEDFKAENRHGNYLVVPYADANRVARPLLYHFRVGTYPAILVCANRPAVELNPALLPTEKSIRDKRCEPEVLNIAGRFMIERRDPTAANFPWATLDAESRAARNVFFGIVLFVLAILAAIGAYFWKTVYEPAVTAAKLQADL